MIATGDLVKIHHRHWTERFKNGRLKESYGVQPIPSIDEHNKPIQWVFLRSEDVGLVIEVYQQHSTFLYLGGPDRWYANCLFNDRLVKVRMEDILKVQGA